MVSSHSNLFLKRFVNNLHILYICNWQYQLTCYLLDDLIRACNLEYINCSEYMIYVKPYWPSVPA